MNLTKEQETIVAKIQALLRKTVDNGATAAEARAAMEAAQRLMTKHKIEAMQVAEKEGKGSDYEVDVEYVVMARKQRYDFDMEVACILNSCFNVNIIFARTSGYHTYIFLGSKEDIAIAKVALDLIIDAMWKGVRRLLKARGEKWTAPVGRAYYYGLRVGYIEGSEQGRIKAYQAAQKNVADRFAIVLYDEKKAREAKEQELTGGRNCKSRYPAMDRHALQTGLRDGATLDLSGPKLTEEKPKQLN